MAIECRGRLESPCCEDPVYVFIERDLLKQCDPLGECFAIDSGAEGRSEPLQLLVAER
jgi:hypothetical protein